MTHDVDGAWEQAGGGGGGGGGGKGASVQGGGGGLGRPVQVAPGISQLTPPLLSTLELKTRETAFNLCFQLQPAPLHLGSIFGFGGSGGAVQVDPGFSQLTLRLLSGTFSS